MYLEGKIQSRKYTGKDGIERTAYDIICHEMKMLGGGQPESAPQANSQLPTQPQRQQAAAPQPVEDIDSGIPF